MAGKYRKSLVRRMTVWFLMIILVPMIVLSAFLYAASVRSYYRQAIDDNYSILNMIAENVVGNAEMVENSIRILSYDEDILDLLSVKRQSNYQLVIRQQDVVKEVLTRTGAFLNPLEGKIVLFTVDDRIPSSYWQVLDLKDNEEAEDFIRFTESEKIDGWVGTAKIYPEKVVIQQSDNRELFCYYRKIFAPAGVYGGLLKCGVSTAKMFAAVDMPEYEGRVHVQSGEKVIYGAPCEAEIAAKIDLTRRAQTVDGQLCIVRNIESLGVQLVMHLNFRETLSQALTSGLPMLITTLASGLFLLLATQMFLRSIRERLNQAVAFAERAKDGHMDILFPEPGSDEVGRLIASFNALLVQLQDMAKQKIENERREKRALRLALQYQMNPHFLFNTLNWLQMSTEMHVDREQLSEGIVRLGRLLRYNLNDGAFAPLSEEMENTREYIRLMNMRKGDLISLDVDMEGLESAQPVMRFIFQPLCENAIQHGMMPGQPLNIRIAGRAEGEGMRFSVENDGAIIPEERLRQLRAGIESEEGQNGVGVANIAARVRLLYGPESTLTVTSEPGCTCVMLYLQSRNTPGT